MNKLLICLLLLSIVFLSTPSLCIALPIEGSDSNGKSMYADDYAAAEKLQVALKNNNRQVVADLIQYPLNYSKPLPSIKNSKEFLKHWDEFFDADNIKIVLAAKAEEFGSHGVSLSDGIIWFNNGRVTSINLETKSHKKALPVAKQTDSGSLYKSAQGSDKIQFQCHTKKSYIRTQYHGEDLRYFSWKEGADLSTKPELELVNGNFEPDGSGGNYTMTFNNGNYTYKLDIGHNICGEDCNDYLTVLKGDEILSHQVCNMANN